MGWTQLWEQVLQVWIVLQGLTGYTLVQDRVLLAVGCRWPGHWQWGSIMWKMV